MLRYSYKGVGGMFFRSPDGAGGSGGGGTGSSSNQGDGQAVATPFDDIDLDELDPTTREKIEKGKADYIATLQSKTALEGRVSSTEQLARRFQAEADRNKAELDRIFGHGRTGGTGATGGTVSEVVVKALTKAGYKESDIQKLGPLFSTMFEEIGGMQQQAIGAGIKPLAETVIAQEAQSAFQQAQAVSPMGILQIPAVAQKTWEYVEKRTQSGERSNPELIANLARIAYVDYLDAERAAGREVATLQSTGATHSTGATGMTTSYTYPGAGASHIRPTAQGGRETNTGPTLNADTEAALATTFASMTRGLTNSDGKQIMPKAFAGKGGRK